VLLNSTVVADNWSDLTDGKLRAPINVTETGKLVVELSTPVWTNVTAGGHYTGDSDCQLWKSMDGQGGFGDAQASDSTWTELAKLPCPVVAHLYCVEVRCGQTPCE
jgi:hypothetical protein